MLKISLNLASYSAENLMTASYAFHSGAYEIKGDGRTQLDAKCKISMTLRRDSFANIPKSLQNLENHLQRLRYDLAIVQDDVVYIPQLFRYA